MGFNTKNRFIRIIVYLNSTPAIFSSKEKGEKVPLLLREGFRVSFLIEQLLTNFSLSSNLVEK